MPHLVLLAPPADVSQKFGSAFTTTSALDRVQVFSLGLCLGFGKSCCCGAEVLLIRATSAFNRLCYIPSTTRITWCSYLGFELVLT